MYDIVNNLNKRICDCEEDSFNEQTYLEFIIEGYEELGCPLSNEQIAFIKTTENNKYLNDLVDEVDYLLSK